MSTEKIKSVGKPWWGLVSVFCFMLLLNWLMPLHRDDYDYALVWETTKHLASMDDIFLSLYRHYLMHGGRMVAFFTQESFLIHDKIWFDFANALVFLGLILLLIWHSMRRVTLCFNSWKVLAAFLLVWLAIPHFGEVAVWMCGSVVYLWTGFWGFLFLLPYNLYFAGQFHKKGIITGVILFLMGLLAGWSVENMSVTFNGIAFLSILYCLKTHQLKGWMVSGFLGSALGFLLLLAAPGNYVRYGEQSGGKGILIHIGNQFAGNGEMLLYVLPVILLLLLVWRGLKISLLEKQGEMVERQPLSFGLGQGVLLAFLAVVLVSYFSGGWLAEGLRDFLVAHVLTPLHVTRPKTIAQFGNVMAGFEEMVLYLGGICIVYSLAKRAMGLSGKAIKVLNQKVSARQVWAAYPAVQYAGVLFVLAFFNNFVMIAAPTFPVRATFSSVCLILVGTLAVLDMPEVREMMKSPMGRVLRLGGGAIGLFLAVSAVIVSYTMTQEQAVRIAYIESKAGSQEVVELPPIAMKNRAMRHVFFVDFGNGVTKGGLCHYYGIKDIRIVEGARMGSSSQ